MATEHDVMAQANEWNRFRCELDGCENPAPDGDGICLSHWWQHFDYTDGGCGYGDE